MRKMVSLVVMLTVVLMASVACQAGKKASGVEGKVVDANGKPLAGIKVVAKQKEPLKGYEKFETKTKSDGSFSFKGLYPESEYAIAPDVVDQCNKKSSEIEMKSAPAGEMKMLKENIVVRLSPLRLSKDGVIIDPRTNLEWAPDPGRSMTWDEANQYAQGLSLAGGGWRLPSLEELRTLYDMSCDDHILPSLRSGRMRELSSEQGECAPRGENQEFETDGPPAHCSTRALFIQHLILVKVGYGHRS